MLDRNWKTITLRSYTAWAFYTLAVITIAPDLIYLLPDRDWETYRASREVSR